MRKKGYSRMRTFFFADLQLRKSAFLCTNFSLSFNNNIFAPDLIFKDNANSFKFIGSVWEKSFVR
ncbi:hypothetical protein CCYN49044_130078 [Capnocytophaga cynodegmi]|nr:hypothetical protein CCYN49044_130078 [Capnocytophaga cynodegmi]